MGKHALILGGGFAGLEAAIQLRQRGLEVTLVSNRSFLFIYPTSIWVPTGETALADGFLDLVDLSRRHGFHFREGTVESISGAERCAVVNGETLTADHLLIAFGAGRMKPKGVEHTRTLGGEPENVSLTQEALAALLARGQGRIAMGFGANPQDPSAVRGGPVFELMFNVETLLRHRGLREKFELTFFAPMPSPGERMGKKAVGAMMGLLEKLGIGRRFGKKIASFEKDGVVFEDGSRLESDLVVFLPGGDGHPVVKASDLPRNEAGFVQIDEGCAVRGLDGVWAIGDAAALEGPDWRSKQGHLAEVMARVAATNIASVEARGATRESYLPHLGITCLLDMGNGAAFIHRDATKEQMVPLPVVGHWLKKGWGTYFKASKRRQVPRLPGM